DGQSLLTVGAYLDGHLVGGTANATRTYFDGRTDVVERAVEGGDRVLLGLGLHDIEGTVHDRLGDGFLAVFHERIHELGDDDIAVFGIGNDVALFGAVTTGHGSVSLLRPLRAILGTALLAILDRLRVEDAAEHVVADAGQVANAPAADQHHGVFLQV